MADPVNNTSRMSSQTRTSRTGRADSQERHESDSAAAEGRGRSYKDSKCSPERRDRRSRSPRIDRDPDRPRKKTGGFKWKDKRRDEDHEEGRERINDGLRRGYRDQYRPRSRTRSRSRSRSPRRRSGRDETDRHRRSRNNDSPEHKEKKKEKKVAPVAPQQEMIIVYVNDRLGTKKAIPCFPTDPIKDFKVIVASMIGRQPHEILLKRQGERPFKDMLTLQDYGVSNNVQLDLEVDTGD